MFCGGGAPDVSKECGSFIFRVQCSLDVEGLTVPRNVGNLLPKDKASRPAKLESSRAPLREPQISNFSMCSIITFFTDIYGHSLNVVNEVKRNFFARNSEVLTRVRLNISILKTGTICESAILSYDPCIREI